MGGSWRSQDSPLHQDLYRGNHEAVTRPLQLRTLVVMCGEQRYSFKPSAALPPLDLLIPLLSGAGPGRNPGPGKIIARLTPFHDHLDPDPHLVDCPGRKTRSQLKVQMACCSSFLHLLHSLPRDSDRQPTAPPCSGIPVKPTVSTSPTPDPSQVIT